MRPAHESLEMGSKLGWGGMNNMHQYPIGFVRPHRSPLNSIYGQRKTSASPIRIGFAMLEFNTMIYPLFSGNTAVYASLLAKDGSY